MIGAALVTVSAYALALLLAVERPGWAAVGLALVATLGLLVCLELWGRRTR